MIRETHLDVSYVPYTQFMEWRNRSGYDSGYAATISWLSHITDQCWTTGHVENLLTILNGVRTLGELVDRSGELLVNHTRYEDHDLSFAPSTFVRPRPFKE